MANQSLTSDTLIPTGSKPLVGRTLPDLNATSRSFFGQSAVQKALPGIALLGGIGLAAVAWMSFQSPAQLPLFHGLADADKAGVADALQAAGITYNLDSATGSITVAESEVHKARMMLAGQGLPKAAPSGDAVLSALPMGSSRAVEGETLRGAREADLARTIEAIDAVKAARVHLALAEPSVFVRDETKSAASVMLTLHQNRTLTNAQVRAMQNLVATSVPGLSPEQVSVVDQSGDLLSLLDNSAENENFQHQIRVEGRYREAVAALLAPMVGRGNFTTEVHADMDFSESQSTRETFPKEDTALRREEGNKSTNATTMTPAVGIPGATSNQPPPASQVTTQPGNSQPVPAAQQGQGQTAETYARSFDVGREISVTHRPQGEVKRLTVAVALKKGTKPLAATEVAKIENLVKSAVGFNAERGDVVAVSSHNFNEVKAEPPAWWDNPWIIPVARQVGGLLAALFAFIMIARPIIRALKSRAERTAEEGVDTVELEQKLLAATEPNNAVPALDQAQRTELVRELVKQNPQRAALVVRQLMQQEAGNG